MAAPLMLQCSRLAGELVADGLTASLLLASTKALGPRNPKHRRMHDMMDETLRGTGHGSMLHTCLHSQTRQRMQELCTACPCPKPETRKPGPSHAQAAPLCAAARA